MTRRIAVTLSTIWLLSIIALAIVGPFVASASPFRPVGAPLEPPTTRQLLGTDALGRDLWSRFLFGARQSLGAATMATSITLILGTSLGLLVVLYPAWVDKVIMSLSNASLAIPGLLLAMLFVAALGPGYTTVILAIGLGGSPGFVRLSRSIFAQIADEAYVDVARALGAGRGRLAWRHILPNAVGPLLSIATTQFAWAFMGITTLTFLGLAGDPSIPEWGAMMNAGRAYLVQAPRLAIIPGAAISLTILAVHQLGLELSERSAPN